MPIVSAHFRFLLHYCVYSQKNRSTSLFDISLILPFVGFMLENDIDVIRKFQSNYPARVKQLHMYNMGAMVDLLLTIVKFCMSEKIQQRVRSTSTCTVHVNAAFLL